MEGESETNTLAVRLGRREQRPHEQQQQQQQRISELMRIQTRTDDLTGKPYQVPESSHYLASEPHPPSPTVFGLATSIVEIDNL